MMKKPIKNIILIFLFCCFPPFLYPQSETDSLKRELNLLPNDTSSISIVLREAYKYKNIDNNIFLQLITIAEKKAIAISNAHLLSKILLWKGISYLELSNSLEASKNLTLAKILAEKIHDEELLASCNVEIGAIYELNGQLDRALAYYNSCLADSSSDRLKQRTRAIILNRISSIFYKKQELKKSIETLKEACKILEDIHDTDNFIASVGNLALYYCHDNQLDSAYRYLMQAKQLITSGNFNSLHNWTGFYEIEGRFYLTKKDYNAALQSYKQCLENAKKISSPTWMYESYHQISYIYEQKQDYRESLKYFKWYAELVDSVVSHDNFIKAIAIQNMYEDKRKENELFRMNKESEAKQVQLRLINQKKKNLTNYIVLLIFVLILFLVFLVILIWHIRSRQNEIQLLKKKNLLIKNQSNEIGNSVLLIAKFQFQMNPHFIFNALHNIQGLILGNDNANAEIQIQRLARLIRFTYGNAEKDYITIEEEIKYLKTYFQFESNNKTNIDFRIRVEKGLEEALIPPMIIQPMIENAIKHAHLEKVSNPYIQLSIAKQDGLLQVSVEDNGMGIPESGSTILKDSHSLSVINSRIGLLFQNSANSIGRAVMIIKTIPEMSSGTVIKFSLPLNYLF